MTRTAALLLTICALVSASQASARLRTTAPTLFIDVRVLLGDHGIRLSRDWGPRGSIVRFSITNTGTRPHSFTFESFSSGFRMPAAFQRLLGARQHRRVLLFLDYRGVLRFYSKGAGDRARKGMHGTFRIGSPPKGKVDG
jgi:hypothetical protein